jgi:MFS family permease
MKSHPITLHPGTAGSWTIGAVGVVAAATTLAALAFGLRAVLGMFLGPLNTSTGAGFAAVSLALAMSQLVSGIAQPLCGVASERFGPSRVVAIGALALAAAVALLPLAQGTLGLMLAFALLAAAVGAVGSTPILLGAVNMRLPAAQAAVASGIVGAGGALGQLSLAPLTQWTMADFGWTTALYVLAAVALVGLPLAWLLPGRPARPARDGEDASAASLRVAFTDARYWWIALGFAACGFHVSFLLAHMPGVIEACGVGAAWSGIWLGILGVANVTGSIGAGFALRRMSHLRLLALVYGARALGVIAFLLAPKSVPVLLVFAAWMGFTYMATVPPTSGLVSRLYGARHLATLFGVVMLVHQVGSFLGVWLGGLAVEHLGGYDAIWLLDIGLAVAAVAIHLLLREPGGAQDATPDPRRTRPASVPADRNGRAAPASRARRFAPGSSPRSVAPSAAGGSG